LGGRMCCVESRKPARSGVVVRGGRYKAGARDEATTILQLSLYSELLAKIQGRCRSFVGGAPAKGLRREISRIRVCGVLPVCDEAIAWGRGEGASKETYPEPVEHCNVCRWFKESTRARRTIICRWWRNPEATADQFETWNAGRWRNWRYCQFRLRRSRSTDPKRDLSACGSSAGAGGGRTEKKLKHECFCRWRKEWILPAAGTYADDLFVDLEGDPFVGEQGCNICSGLR